jgi:hypothetical protein
MVEKIPYTKTINYYTTLSDKGYLNNEYYGKFYFLLDGKLATIHDVTLHSYGGNHYGFFYSNSYYYYTTTYVVCPMRYDARGIGLDE